MTDNKPEKPDNSEFLDKERGEFLKSSYNPKNDQERMRLSFLSPEQIYAIDILQGALDFFEQNAKAELYFINDEGTKSYFSKAKIKNIEIEGPIFCEVDDKVESTLANKLINNLLNLSVSVGGKLLKYGFETVRDIGRPVTSLLGGLSGLLGSKELEEAPEETQVLE